MNEKIMEFSFQGKLVRFNGTANQPLCMAADVCSILGIKDTRSSLRKLDTNEKLIGKIYRSGQWREAWFITEPGLYKLIFRSYKPIAKQFQRWICYEVIPSIRANGYYQLTNVSIPTNNGHLL